MLYYRKKILLSIIELFNNSLTAKQLQKLAFLYSVYNKENSYYRFLPYKYGCFSFNANQDLISLYRDGLLELKENTNAESNYSIYDKSSYFDGLKSSDKEILIELKKEFIDFSQDELIKYIYIKYPYFAQNSVISKYLLNKSELCRINACKSTNNNPLLLSLGYEGYSIEEYINILIKNNVKVLFDVRRNAYSMKYGFSKQVLQNAAKGCGIEYIHLPELGIESKDRKYLRLQSDYDELFNRYEKTTLSANKQAIEYIIRIIQNKKRVSLLCYETKPAQCHRTRIANNILQQTENLDFKEL